MRITKKLTALVLALLVVLCPVSVPLATEGFAAPEVVLQAQADKTEVLPGDIVTLTYSFDQAVNLRGFGLEYTYDRTAFEAVSGEWASVIHSNAILTAVDPNGCAAVFAAEEKFDISAEEAVFTLTLKATDVACGEAYEVLVETSELLPTVSQPFAIQGAHSFDNACDEICNACLQKVRDAKHVYDDPYDAECNECKLVRELPTYVHKAHRTDSVTVSVSVSEAIGTQGFGLDFLNAYDRDVFEWVDGDWNQTIKSLALLSSTHPDGEAVFVAAEPVELFGEVFSFTLKVKEDAVFGDYDVLVGVSSSEQVKISTTAVMVHGSADTDETAFDAENHWKICSVCGKKDENSVKKHVFDSEEDCDCSDCAYTKYVLGDLDGNKEVDLNDAIYLLYHVNFSASYPVNQPVDFDGDGEANLNDAIYLLYHVNFPSSYPLH